MLEPPPRKDTEGHMITCYKGLARKESTLICSCFAVKIVLRILQRKMDEEGTPTLITHLRRQRDSGRLLCHESRDLLFMLHERWVPQIIVSHLDVHAAAIPTKAGQNIRHKSL
jgi:hypothetical protein